MGLEVYKKHLKIQILSKLILQSLTQNVINFKRI